MNCSRVMDGVANSKPRWVCERMLRSSAGFTLVELLITIGMITLLAALLMPVMRSALESSYQTSCAANQRQLGSAQMMYADDFNGYVTPSLWDGALGLGGAWYEKKKKYCDNDLMVFQCPAGKEQIYQSVNYVYSGFYGHYWMGSPVNNPSSYTKYLRQRISRIKKPQSKCAEIDGDNKARYAAGAGIGPGNLYDPWSNKPCIYDRHYGAANVLWLDGHSELLLSLMINEGYMH